LAEEVNALDSQKKKLEAELDDVHRHHRLDEEVDGHNCAEAQLKKLDGELHLSCHI